MYPGDCFQQLRDAVEHGTTTIVHKYQVTIPHLTFLNYFPSPLLDATTILNQHRFRYPNLQAQEHCSAIKVVLR